MFAVCGCLLFHHAFWERGGSHTEDESLCHLASFFSREIIFRAQGSFYPSAKLHIVSNTKNKLLSLIMRGANFLKERETTYIILLFSTRYRHPNIHDIAEVM